MYVCFELSKSACADDLWDALSAAGADLVYSTEDPEGSKFIYGRLAEEFIPAILKNFPEIIAIIPAGEEKVDWEAQWSQHGLDFRNGFVHLDLSKYAPGCDRSIQLEPGAGFGDLSHATTRLTLKQMAPFVKGSYVIDVGCGSGVLAIAAAGLGAKGVHGIDIDPSAIHHARRNAAWNHYSDSVTFGLPHEPFEVLANTPLLIAMNMISTEQQAAWGALEHLHGLKSIKITSGILAEDEAEYLAWCGNQGWKLLERAEEEGWLAYAWR